MLFGNLGLKVADPLEKRGLGAAFQRIREMEEIEFLQGCVLKIKIAQRGENPKESSGSRE